MKNRIRINGVLYEAVNPRRMNEAKWHEFDRSNYALYDASNLPDGSKPLIYTSKIGVDVVLGGNDHGDGYVITIDYVDDYSGSDVGNDIEFYKEYKNINKDRVLDIYDKIIKNVRMIDDEGPDTVPELRSVADILSMKEL